MMKSEFFDELRDYVRRGIERRRQVIVYEVAKQIQNATMVRGSATGGNVAASETWERVESLSQLRALVGGRFQNLKDRWVKAGFPLREHRGDRSGKKNVDYEGWVELASWIHQQGFEIRLAGEEDAWLFELRKT